jgi:hypothetical protein
MFVDESLPLVENQELCLFLIGIEPDFSETSDMTERPIIPVNTEDSGDMETFMHQTLRPVMKQLNEKLLTLSKLNLKSHEMAFKLLQPFEKEERVNALVSTNQPFKNTAVGMVLGLLNETEFEFYKGNTRELNKRIGVLLRERLSSQLQKL